MSQQRTIDCTCPHCGRPGTFEVWDSINVDLDPEMRAKLMNDELFEWTCPHCGGEVYAPYGFIYHDMKHKFMLFYEPEDPEDRDKYLSFNDPVYGTGFMQSCIARDDNYCVVELGDPTFVAVDKVLLHRVYSLKDNEVAEKRVLDIQSKFKN